MSRIPLSVATWDYDRLRALIDGRIEVEGCDLTYLTLPPEECFQRAWSGAEFDVAELGFASYLISCASGDGAYVGLPVFVSRAFRHSGIYVRADRGINRPENLRGKRIGVPIYGMAAAVWIRGFLHDDYGIAPAEMHWVRGLETPGRKGLFHLHLPPGFPLEIAPPDETLSGMLAGGSLDAIITARAPSCFDAGDPLVRCLFGDYRAAGACLLRTDAHLPDHAPHRRPALAGRTASLASDAWSKRSPPPKTCWHGVEGGRRAEDSLALGRGGVRGDSCGDGPEILAVRRRAGNLWRSPYLSESMFPSAPQRAAA